MELRPVVSYLTAAFALPAVHGEESWDLRAYYFGIRGWLFGLLAAGNVLDGLRRVLEGEPLAGVSVWSNLVSAVLVGSLAVSDNERYHAGVTLLTVALFGLFLVRAALTLG